ncbi:ABC transporter ATP-binding protein [Saccharothrix luteola]|uniref:ABC transporter ATP-binding protein n=1 Tax=Saccharothrix luteola TaxID=2893018 RepID=UPI001E5A3DB0|nr:ATP-binding cassette domain-containing protein [Saccharothrix luteola]MCC8243008.1 ATP-binding cassette domain-containing protein [Saccharothrix luteola]
MSPIPAGSSDPVVEARDLSRAYRVVRRDPGVAGALRSLVRPRREERTAVDRVSFAIERGELVGLLGPNGAGKSTLIKMMTGILVPSSGSLVVNGRVPHRDRIRHAAGIGVVFGQRTQLWWDLPVRDSFDVLHDIHRIPGEVFRRRLAEFDDLLALSTFWDTPARHLSLGQRVRSDLAAALLHAPPIVFLDEPTIGMDVVVKEQVRGFLNHVVRELGRTVVLTTHDMGDVQRLCRRLLLINGGRLVFDGGVEELERRTGATRDLCVVFTRPTRAPALPGCALVEQSGAEARYRLAGDAEPERVLRVLTAAAPVADCSFRKRSLEELMRDVYQGTSELVAADRRAS